jgi:hypothetical protein
MFFVFLLKLGLATLLSTFGFALAFLPFMGLLVVSGKKKIPAAVYDVVSGVPLAFCCGAWAAYLAAFAHEHASAHRLGWNWLYFVAAFCFCTVPHNVALSRSLEHPALVKEDTSKVLLVFFCIKLATRVGYVLFAIWPSLADLSHGWVGNLVF